MTNPAHEDSSPERAALDYGRGSLILLIEDDDSIRFVCSLILRNSEMQVIVAATGSEGARLCREYRDAIKVAVIDVGLPDTSVSDLVVSLTEAGFRGKRLFMSATPMNLLTKQEVAIVQNESFLQKPFAAQDLVAAIAAL